MRRANYPALSMALDFLLERGVDVTPSALTLFPELEPRFAKTYEFFLRTLRRLIRSVYDGNLDEEFIVVMDNLISGQLRRAFKQAWDDEGTGGAMPDFLVSAWSSMVAEQQSFVEPLYRDIVEARENEKPLNSVLYRAELWANQYNGAYDTAVSLIASNFGGRLQWVYGDTEHCDTCLRLNGIVAYAREWEELGVRPRRPPNPILQCGGWNCQCRRVPTKQRRSPKAYETILNIVSR